MTNNRLSAFENSITQSQNTLPVAKQMFTVMAIGTFTNLCFPYSHYPTAGITGERLFPIIWENIQALGCAGFKVMSLTGDGCSGNKKFFHMHKLVAGNTDTPKSTNKI